MGKTSEHQRIEELRELLQRANHAYFVDTEPIMPDSEYDALLAELIELEQAHPELHDANSPTQRVGGEPIEGFTTVSHRVRMMSIDNTYSVDDLKAWHERVIKGLEAEGVEPAALHYVCDPKIDGVAVSLRYEKGGLALALTRGDGEKGDDVTAQVRTVRSIPLRLRNHRNPPPEVLEIRGEIFMPDEEFARINAEREKVGETPFANARNATAGTLKQLDPKVVAGRRLSFVEALTPSGAATSIRSSRRSSRLPRSGAVSAGAWTAWSFAWTASTTSSGSGPRARPRAGASPSSTRPSRGRPC